MIKFAIQRNILFKIPFEKVLKKIEFARESGSFKYHLSQLTFDAAYTKPATLTGWDIIEILYNSNLKIHLGSYTQNYFAWKFIPVNAYKPTQRVDQILFNTRMLDLRTERQWEETLWHELTHIADHLSPNRFDHGLPGSKGENDLTGKDETAPVKFAKFMANVNLINRAVMETVH